MHKPTKLEKKGKIYSILLGLLRNSLHYMRLHTDIEMKSCISGVKLASKVIRYCYHMKRCIFLKIENRFSYEMWILLHIWYSKYRWKTHERHLQTVRINHYVMILYLCLKRPLKRWRQPLIENYSLSQMALHQYLIVNGLHILITMTFSFF